MEQVRPLPAVTSSMANYLERAKSKYPENLSMQAYNLVTELVIDCGEELADLMINSYEEGILTLIDALKYDYTVIREYLTIDEVFELPVGTELSHTEFKGVLGHSTNLIVTINEDGPTKYLRFKNSDDFFSPTGNVTLDNVLIQPYWYITKEVE